MWQRMKINYNITIVYYFYSQISHKIKYLDGDGILYNNMNNTFKYILVVELLPNRQKDKIGL